jgi:DNA-binding FadR family transcriptional regulator
MKLPIPIVSAASSAARRGIQMNLDKQDLVRSYILDGLAAGTLTAGAKLPPERELAERLGTTRTSVRQALLVLEAEHRVTRHVGRGTFITDGAGEDVARRGFEGEDRADKRGIDVSPAELMQAREVIEPHIVELVVISATEADLSRIGRILGRQPNMADAGVFEESDVMFHLALARATHNKLIVAVAELIVRARSSPEWRKLKGAVAQRHGGSRGAAIEEHGEIFDAITSRDAHGASRAMRRHLDQVRLNLLG